MLTIQALASGSKGNVTYIGSKTTNILVDVGLSLPDLIKRMQAAEIDPESIDAILITHEHGDHIAGLQAFLKKHKSKVYLHKDVVKLFANIPDSQVETFDSNFKIGDINVSFFNVPHDSNFCFGYSFSCGTAKISLATDLGRITPETIMHMSSSQIVLLESNHCLVKLRQNQKYPAQLKRRITSSNGHLSNAATSLAVYELAKNNVQQVILAHLSEQNNSPNLAYSFVRDFLATKGIIEGKDIAIDVATQNKIGFKYQID